MATLRSMRIIAGEFRGRRLLAPESDATRPITDRAKQSVFDVLNPRLAGANIYDCFAGTGSLGLESLSRGACLATFFEADRSALKRLTENLATLKVQERSRIIPGDIFKWSRHAPPPEKKIDIVFLDPPYALLRERGEDLQSLARTIAQDHLAPDGLVIFRHDSADVLDLPPFSPIEIKNYGPMRVEFLARK
jgi:16S rRNA (guanine966-N2)-methyltransferase